jgi:hypothetical protein
MRLYRVLKNSGFDFALKGRGFSRAVSAAKSMAALAAEVAVFAWERLLPQPVRGWGAKLDFFRTR